MPSTISYHNPFSESITQFIENNKAITAYDASMKSNQLGGYWIILNKDRMTEIGHKIFNKQQEYRLIEGGKATIMLDLIEIVVYKSKYINNRSIIVGNDNQLLVQIINQ